MSALLRAARASLVAAAALLAACDRPGERHRAVILVTVDTLRADHLSSWGYARRTSPRLDALARRGASFAWALSTCSYTLPAHASMLTGLDPSFHSVGLLNFELPLRPEERTLAEICRAGGLRTFAVVSNFILRKEAGLAQGFEVYDDALPDQELVRGVPERRAAHAVDSALALLAAAGNERFFLWLHLQDPHGPYTPARSVGEPEPVPGAAQPPRDARTLPVGSDQSGFRAIPQYQALADERAFEDYRSRYDREVRATDAEIGRLVDALDARGLLDTTLLIVTADHGEALGEDEFFFAHCHSVGLDQVHVPLIVAGPGVREGARFAQPVSNMDVFATILEFLDLPAPGTVHSESLLGAVQRGEPPPDRPVHCSSISQRGVAHRGEYLRTDRVAASEREFWRLNPLNQSYFAPLGTDAWSLAGERPVEIAPRPELLGELERFAGPAEAALGRLLKGFDPGALEEGARRSLRALGYAK